MEKMFILAEKEKIIAQIRKYVPLMGQYFEFSQTLKEFSANLYNFPVSPIHTQRQILVKRNIEEKLQKLFGDDFKTNLKIGWGNNLAFNIADHHQMLSHPFLLSANAISSVDKFFKQEKQDAIVVVSSGDVPPNNYFSKSGFVLHEKRVPLFSVSEREYTTFYIPKRNFDFVEKLKNSHRWHKFNNKEQIFLQNHEQQITSCDFSKCRDYADQISIIVKNTWPLLFEEKIRQNLPELLYITQEELTTECLKHLLKEDNFISNCLFEPEFRNKALDNFRGIVVAWRENEGKGTHFFWKKYPGEPRSIRLFIEGEFLVPQHEKYKHLKIPLDKDVILDLLEKREIYPSLFLIFSVLNFYSGVRPLTGFGSTVYLTLFRDAWVKTLKDTKYQDEIPLVQSVDTTGLVAGLAAFFRRYGNSIKALYAHDIYCDGQLTQEYLETVFNMKFSELLSIGTADMYDYFSSKYVPQQEKINKTINFNDLANITFDYL